MQIIPSTSVPDPDLSFWASIYKQKQKIREFTVLWLLDNLSLMTDVNEPLESNKQKKTREKRFTFW